MAMTAIYSRHVVLNDGSEFVRSIIVADEDPVDLDITGANVDGVNDDAIFSAGSIIFAPSANYYTAENGGSFNQKE